MNYSSYTHSASPGYSAERDTTRRVIDDILHKPSAEEVAALERQEAAAKAAALAKKASKAEAAERKRAEKAVRSDDTDDKASSTSGHSTSSLGSLRQLLPGNSNGKAKR